MLILVPTEADMAKHVELRDILTDGQYFRIHDGKLIPFKVTIYFAFSSFKRLS
jgi:hypothetical protein